MCIKDSIKKHAKKMVKICQTGLLKLNFETRPKKRIFRFLPKISAGHGWSWKFFFANYQILGPLGCQGWVVIPQNVKKVKITAPYCTVMWCSALWCMHFRIHRYVAAPFNRFPNSFQPHFPPASISFLLTYSYVPYHSFPPQFRAFYNLFTVLFKPTSRPLQPPYTEKKGSRVSRLQPGCH